jgi:hypothetical protein
MKGKEESSINAGFWPDVVVPFTEMQEFWA